MSWHEASQTWLVVEHGYDQADAVRARFEAAGFGTITLTHDLGKNPRITCGVYDA